MRLYKLDNLSVFPLYDIQDRVVVRASSEEHARTIANESKGDEGAIWMDPAKARCVVLDDEGEAGLICRDHNTG